MSHFGSILVSSVFLFCTFTAPINRQACSTESIVYQETIMPIDMNTVSVSYLSKAISRNFSLAIRCPDYNYSPALGACGSVAGGNIIGFYDRYDENLIPNHISGTPIGTTYNYSAEDAAVRDVITQLYHYMGSNTVGTTEDDFITGLTNFCKDKGKSISFSSCMKLGSFSYTTAQSYLESNQPIVLFLSGYNVGTMFEYDNRDTISYYVSDANHIMVGFGHCTYVYTTSTGTISYQFIKVASGVVGVTSGLYNINYLTKINDALAVNIY